MQRRRFSAGRSLIAVAAAVGFVASACGGESGPPGVTWYVNPDAGGQEQLAAQCTEAAEGEYQITTALLWFARPKPSCSRARTPGSGST